MSCKFCESKRVAHVSAKCSDLCYVEINSAESDDYVPGDMGIGGGDYVSFSYCLDCGKIQGQWPIKKTKLEDDD